MGDVLVKATNITKRFGALTALNGVNMEINRGEVIALLGDNGAGKSTFTKVLSGAYSATEGELVVSGKSVHFSSPKEASDCGIATIYQELALAENLSIAENVFLGRELKRQVLGIPFLRMQAMQDGGNRAAKELGVDFIYSGPVDTNPMDQLQIVQNLIAQGVKAISVSVLDASSLAPVVEQAKSRGISLYTSDSDAPNSGRAVYVAQATDQGLGESIIDEMVKRVGDRGKIGIVSGEATASNLNAWIGFMQARVKAKYPNVTLLAPQFAGGTASRAA